MDTKGCIFIVDDDLSIRKTLSHVLRAKGYAPVAVATGEAALYRLEEEWPVVALIDLKLEDMSGLELVEKIKARSPSTECIVVTGYASQSSAIEAVNLGAYGYVQKPYNVEQLLVTIRRAIEKREVGQSLRESEEKYRALFEASTDAVFLQTWEGRVLDCNGSACEIFGYAREELIGLTIADLVSEEAMIMLPAVVTEELATSGAFVAATGKRKDGQVFPAEVNTRHVTIDGKRLAVAYVRDITERQRVEEALRQRNCELALLNRAGQAFASILDLDRVLATVLDEVCRLLGVVASSIWLVDAETGELVCRQVTGPSSEIVRGWRLSPGEGVVGRVARSGECLIVPDTRADSRHFKGVDQQTKLALRSILAVPLRIKQDVIGVLQVVDTEIDRFGPADLALMEPLAASAGIAIDNARLVEALRQRTAELEARNEELDAFAHTVAHDLKTPLTFILGYADVLKEDFALLPVEELGRYLQAIVRSGRRMKNIIGELLLFAEVRMVEVGTGPLDMASIVAGAQEQLAHIIEECQAEIILPETWPVAVGYAPWVEEVWVNYLSNGIKYGGQPPRVELGATVQADSVVHFWVRDNGPGIPLEAQSRLFTPFTRLDQVRTEGYGLGLSIARRIVEKLGGRVEVESEVGEGSTFAFVLPIATDADAGG